MSLTISDILTRNLFPGLELRAGADHSSNIVSWVNIMEILDTTESVKAGELLITTGYGLDDRSSRRTGKRALRQNELSDASSQSTGVICERTIPYLQK